MLGDAKKRSSRADESFIVALSEIKAKQDDGRVAKEAQKEKEWKDRLNVQG
ncbi:hypothetical protein AGMMS49921_13770 [Endomicrobiia bacterium]|nr:hypothetical protein AGMMS49921_13770 [Endomicrobiia bacterium]